MWGLRILQVTIAAMLAHSGGWKFDWLGYVAAKYTCCREYEAITSAAGPHYAAPFTRYAFRVLRDGLLWSKPAMAVQQAEHINTEGLTVATNWVVSPPLPGRDAVIWWIYRSEQPLSILSAAMTSDTVVHQPS